MLPFQFRLSVVERPRHGEMNTPLIVRVRRSPNKLPVRFLGSVLLDTNVQDTDTFLTGGL